MMEFLYVLTMAFVACGAAAICVLVVFLYIDAFRDRKAKDGHIKDL